MKVSEIINEQPYEHEGSMSFTVDTDLAKDFGTMSKKAIDRMYELLFTVHSDRGEEVLICKLKNHNTFFIRGMVKNDRGRFDTVYSFRAASAEPLQIVNVKGKPIREKRVFVQDEYRNLGIASKTYLWIIENGFYLISDQEHFSDSKMLWKKIAGSSQTKYNVFIYDYDKGLLGSYDETNDDKIWTQADDFKGFSVVLVLSAK